MQEQMKKAAPDGANIESSSGEQIALPGIRLSENDSTAKWTALQGISALLREGENNAIPLRHLETVTGLQERQIRSLIRRERLEGTPILANNRSGYYLPATDEERAACVSSMRHRAAEIQRAADAIEQAGR